MFLSRLKIVKKMILVGAVVGLLAFFIPSDVQATDPPACDLSTVDVNHSGKQPLCYSKDDAPLFGTVCLGGKATTCPVGHIYCTKEKGGWCWPEGATSKDPSCPPGCVSDLIGQCFVQTDPLGAYDSNKPCKKNYCAPEGGTIYEFVNIKCVAAGKTPVFLCLSNDPNDPKKPGICDTAIGKITTDPASFIGVILKLVMGIAGTVALFMLILAGYQVLTSSGNPEKLAASKELIVSVLTGIVLIVFSLVLLRAVGVDILGIPALKNAQPMTTNEAWQKVK